MRLSKKEAKALGFKFDEEPKDHYPKEGQPKSRKKKVEGQTPAEVLFDALCEKWGLPAPVHEYKFHPDRDWRFDYLFEGLIAVEKEGSIYGTGSPCPVCKRRAHGGHSSPDGIKRDIEKYNAAQLEGFIVLRFTTEQFDSGEAFNTIKKALYGEEETCDGEMAS